MGMGGWVLKTAEFDADFESKKNVRDFLQKILYILEFFQTLKPNAHEKALKTKGIVVNLDFNFASIQWLRILHYLFTLVVFQCTSTYTWER